MWFHPKTGGKMSIKYNGSDRKDRVLEIIACLQYIDFVHFRIMWKRQDIWQLPKLQEDCCNFSHTGWQADHCFWQRIRWIGKSTFHILWNTYQQITPRRQEDGSRTAHVSQHSQKTEKTLTDQPGSQALTLPLVGSDTEQMSNLSHSATHLWKPLHSFCDI